MARKLFHVHVCQVCGFKAIVASRVMPEIDAINGSTSDDARTLWVCMTCFETPIGCVSENVKHRRLPEKEYR